MPPQLVVAADLLCVIATLCSCIYGVQRARTLWCPPLPPAPPPLGADMLPHAVPHVTVQLPLFNERAVAARVIAAACALQWPRARLRVQVLDDSDDPLARREVVLAVAEGRAAGVDVQLLRRVSRDGYKAGALAHGLRHTHSPLLAIFDSDFVPAPDFLRRAVAAMGPDVALVQCRWGHLNAPTNWLTRAQAALLDAHFGVEQAGRAAAGRFFGFNGTAGVWRRSAIEAAGGWDAQTLTEDLDLALRAWLGGARFVFLDDVVVPAELPEDARALRRQQARWARGAMEVARHRLRDVWRGRLATREKMDLTLKLTQNVGYVFLTVLLVAAPLSSWGAPASTPWGLLLRALWLGALLLGAGPLVMAIARGARRRARGTRLVVDVLLALALASALAPSNAVAALRGLSGRRAPFLRTPKRGGGLRGEVVPASWLASAELALGAAQLVAWWVTPLPLLLLWSGGLCAFAVADLRGAR